ncbi:MAG TPA: protein kinase, partial [Polyangiaceae bacterium]|nr:protein kinase [Polyangiaceae bacterium]
QVYIAFDDGRFWGVGPGSEGRLEFQETSPQSSTAYALTSGTLVEKSVRHSSFDPTRRAWYVSAKEAGAAVWSKPYVFYFNHHPGVTRAMPLYKDHGRKRLLGVVGVDFDVEALTAFMAAGESGKEGARSVVFSPEGVVLAYPFGAKKIAALPSDHEVITHHALSDHELSALVQSVLALPQARRNVELLRFVAREPSGSAGTQVLASVKTLGAGGPEWYVASFAAESTILHELHNHRARSLWIGGFALLLAVAMGWWLSKYILRVKGQVAVAQADAQRARKQVRDLGSYQLLSLLGEGGMGEVWRARHRLLARQAAIKLIKLGTTVGQRREEQRERFRREAQAIAGLRSRNTVALYDYGVTPDGTLFYVMELLDGIDLSRLVSRHRAQPPDRVRQILIQVCNSLSEAHDAQLIHRDIKPANLFLCREADEV